MFYHQRMLFFLALLGLISMLLILQSILVHTCVQMVQDRYQMTRMPAPLPIRFVVYQKSLQVDLPQLAGFWVGMILLYLVLH